MRAAPSLRRLSQVGTRPSAGLGPARRRPCVAANIRSLANAIHADDKVEPRLGSWHVYGSGTKLSSLGRDGGNEKHGSVDSRTLKLGETIRTLRERLPTLLTNPLPYELLSPQIKLHLFPSTHPHLPTVSGRIAYTGALWTAPVAWGCLPVLGNVRLDILSQRMVSCNGQEDEYASGKDKLVVRWKTSSGDAEGPVSADQAFHGLFIFEFDDQGRIVKHTIEHAEECKNHDRMTKVVSVTDWLLGRAPWKKKRDDHVPELAWCRHHERQ